MTIFIIVGVLLISAIALFFLFRSGIVPGISGSSEINPNSYMTTCIEDKLIESVEILSQGGYIKNPLNRTFKFDKDKKPSDISYLCYNQNYYAPCVNQEPVLIQHLKKEIYDYIKDDVEICFNKLKLSLENQRFTVNGVYRDFEVKLMPKKIVLEIDADITATKTDETKKIDNLKTSTLTRFYDLALVVQEIVSQEARFCNFENLGFMLLYPQFNIDKFRTGDSTIIYTVQHRDSKEKFRFAIRGCVIPPGL